MLKRSIFDLSLSLLLALLVTAASPFSLSCVVVVVVVVAFPLPLLQKKKRPMEPPQKKEERNHRKKRRERGEVNHRREPQKREGECHRSSFFGGDASVLLLSCALVMVIVRPSVEVNKRNTGTIKKEREGVKVLFFLSSVSQEDEQQARTLTDDKDIYYTC